LRGWLYRTRAALGAALSLAAWSGVGCNAILGLDDPLHREADASTGAGGHADSAFESGIAGSPPDVSVEVAPNDGPPTDADASLTSSDAADASDASDGIDDSRTSGDTSFPDGATDSGATDADADVAPNTGGEDGPSDVAPMVADGEDGPRDAVPPNGDVDGPSDAGPIVGEHTVPRSTFYVDGRSLRDPCGQEIVLRGINKMVIVNDRSCGTCPEIARTNANSVRMLWFATVDNPLSDMANAVGNALLYGLIPIINLDEACIPLASLGPAITFWTQPDNVAFIQQHQAHLILNIAGAAGQSESATDFQSYYTSYVQTMRTAGIHVPLIVDANNCGRNAELLLSVAPALLAADPDHNLLFSMHWYESSANESARVTNVVQTAVSNNIPFMIGEFASVGTPLCSPSPGVPYRTILSESQAHRIGYLPWEWGPDNDDCKPDSGGQSPLDMTGNGTFGSLRPGWATEVAVTDTNSIMNTSVRSAFITSGGVCP